MAGASHRDIALQKLAAGEITESQFRYLEAKLFPPSTPPQPAKLQFRAGDLDSVLFTRETKPPVETPVNTSDHPDPAHAALLDYLRAHPEPNPNHKQHGASRDVQQPTNQRTVHPMAAVSHAAQTTPTNVAASIDQMVAASR